MGATACGRYSCLGHWMSSFALWLYCLAVPPLAVPPGIWQLICGWNGCGWAFAHTCIVTAITELP